jgi:hypothetical protein
MATDADSFRTGLIGLVGVTSLVFGIELGCRHRDNVDPIVPKAGLERVKLFVPPRAQLVERGLCQQARADAFAEEIATMAATQLRAAGFAIVRDGQLAYQVKANIRISLISCSGEHMNGSGWIGLQSTDETDRRSRPSTELSHSYEMDDWRIEVQDAVRHVQRFSDLVVPKSLAGDAVDSRDASTPTSAALAAPVAVDGGGQATNLAAGSSIPPASTVPDAAPPPAAGCFPACRTGFLCHKSQCISLCNPPCDEAERCSSHADCVSLCNPPCGPKEKCTARAECVPLAREPGRGK